jgi:methylglutaconyl-CoA hydratase
MTDLVQIDRDGNVARIYLNRPEVRNALNEPLIQALTSAFETVGAEDSISTIVLAGRGESLCAGADINWMRPSLPEDPERNIADLMPLGRMLRALAQLPQTTIARVRGSVYGGGIGLVSACDIAIGSCDSKFCFSEVRLGIVPGMIAPYALRAIGQRAARRYFQTAEVFDAAEARHIGLLHETANSDRLDDNIDRLLQQLRAAAPSARRVAKRSVEAFQGRAFDAELMLEIAVLIAGLRSGVEGVEGLSAFLEKRKPSWN